MKRVPSLVADAGSFRDRSNRVYTSSANVYRGINDEVKAIWTRLRREKFFQEMIASGDVVATTMEGVSGQCIDPQFSSWSAVLKHARIPFVSYPYEWSFSMLRDAALLHLDLLERSIENGWILKDASAYNIQFLSAKPVFIDIPSFEPYRAGDPWGGYRQFCMMFLFPLMLKAYKGIDFQPFLRSDLEGIDPLLASRILDGASRFRRGVLGNVYLHSKMQQRAANNDLCEASKLKEDSDCEIQSVPRFSQSKAMVLGHIQGLSRTIRSFRLKDRRTTWGNYDTEHSYADSSFHRKREFVQTHVSAKRRKLVWDIGCNTGTFSQICAPHADHVIAIDGDQKAIDRLYATERSKGSSNILPLVVNLANSSPDHGWNGLERKRLENRGRPDMVLALALIHHLVIAANIPMQEFLSWLHALGGELIIEFVGPADDMVKMLLRNRKNQYTDYNQAAFESISQSMFNILDVTPLKSGDRTLYFMAPR